MFYGIEKAAEYHRQELLRDAERRRQVRQCVGQPFRVRQPVGRVLVRLGSRLNDESRHEPRLAGLGDAG